jgi:hypothetical protein
MLNRFLGALKSQLEKKWHDQTKIHKESMYAATVEKPSNSGVRGHTRQCSRALRPQPVRLQEAEDCESEPLSPAIQPEQVEEGTAAKKDGISATLEFVRALIGYILYDSLM